MIKRVIPAEYMKGVTQKELDKEIQNYRFRDAKLKANGDVHISMTNEQYNNLIKEKGNINAEAIKKMLGKEKYGIRDIKHDVQFSKFDIHLYSKVDLDFEDSFVTEELVRIGKEFNAYLGNKGATIKLTFIDSKLNEKVIER